MLANPILNKSKNLVLYIIFWLMIICLNFLLLYLSFKLKLETALIDSLVFYSILGALGLSYWYPTKYISLEDNRKVRFVINHFIGGVISSAIWLAGGYFVINNLFNYTHDFSLFFANTLIGRFIIGALFYYLITSYYYLFIYYNNLQEKNAREAELKNLITQAELKTLKFQINPHFIFNSLNSMSALTTINPEKAREMILKLADFLRFTLANNEKQKNTLGEELKNIRLYLDIEKIRFEDKFEFIENIDEGCLECTIPNMILQPLFENVIKHAVYDALEPVRLNLTCKKNDNSLKIILENNFESGSSSNKNAGIGIKNIQNRLMLMYGQENLIDIKKENNVFKLTLIIPG
jgi:two-component system, LytTR family, sensor kinase